MKSSGIVRHIDDLGRIVIPKELRRRLRIRENDPLEISLEGNTVSINRYSTLAVNQASAQAVVDAMHQHFGAALAVCDYMKVVAAAPNIRHLIGCNVSDPIRAQIDQYETDTELTKPLVLEDMAVSAIIPITTDEALGEGAVLLFYKSGGPADAVAEKRCAAMTAQILGQQIKY